MERRIIIAGSGGQGILFLGRLIAYTGMLAGKEVTWFPSYGAEIRGGTANCTVIISDEMIGSPVIRNPDILIVMNEASYDRFSGRLISGGILIYDSSMISNKEQSDDIKLIGVPASEIAASAGNSKLSNMVMAGAFAGATGIYNSDLMCKAVEAITPVRSKGSVNTNKDLILRGYKLTYTANDQKS